MSLCVTAAAVLSGIGAAQTRQNFQSSMQVNAILLERGSVARHLATGIKPSKLKLDFLGDAESLEIGCRLVHPLQNITPLKECSIRLNLKHHLLLQLLAIDTATGVKGLTSPPKKVPRHLGL
ncbi:hypothetical protein EAF04_002317 [Stromatinia cepivora]|nr:hypothetical protein EAF04_002317 [Stromatinia cepivora]